MTELSTPVKSGGKTGQVYYRPQFSLARMASGLGYNSNQSFDRLSRDSVVRKSPPVSLAAREARRERQRNSCLEFILIIIFMVGFLLLMWIHEDIAHIYELEHVMELTLTKRSFGQHSHTFRDVKDVVEIWEWLDLGLLPTLVKHTDPVPPSNLPHSFFPFVTLSSLRGLRLVVFPPRRPTSISLSAKLRRILILPLFRSIDFSPHLFYLYVDWALAAP
jgi:hypothetical protein